MIGKSTKGRWLSSQGQIQNLPRIRGTHDVPPSFDYGAVELKLISAMYPGKDGIGADVEVKSEGRRKRSKVPSRK